MPLSADTLIRRVKRAAHLSALPQVRVLGVDDWAWCKGQTFGTILVDLERSQVVDLLPTRSADSLGEWLAQHPEVTTVSRDRQGVYAEGARRVVPEAVQVADRFHLVLNLIHAVERELAVNRRHLRIASLSAPVLPPLPTSRSEAIRVRSSVMRHQVEVARQRRQQKLELFRTIKQMRGAGMKVNQIARQLGLCRRRIDKWIQLDELPERSRMQPRPGMPEPFRDYFCQRWEAGCRHGRTLLAEIRKLGYVGCYSGLAKFLSPWRQPAETRRAISAFPDASQLEPTISTGSRQLSPQVAAALLSKVRAELTSQQARIVDTLKRQCPGFAVMRKLVTTAPSSSSCDAHDHHRVIGLERIFLAFPGRALRIGAGDVRCHHRLSTATSGWNTGLERADGLHRARDRSNSHSLGAVRTQGRRVVSIQRSKIASQPPSSYEHETNDNGRASQRYPQRGSRASRNGN
jgi:transposase